MKQKKYVMGMDCGTTSTRVIVVDLNGNVLGSAQQLNPLEYPAVGRVICDGNALIENIYDVTKKALDKAINTHNIDVEEIAAMSFTMFRATDITRDKDGGFTSPIYIWQDLRSSEVLPEMEEKIKEAGLTLDEWYDMCGFPMSVVAPLGRLYWHMVKEPESYAKCTRIHTTMGLIVKAFGADDYYDDLPTTPWMQMNGYDFYYDSRLTHAFGVDTDKLAPLRSTGDVIGKVDKYASERTGIPEGVPLVMGIGDIQSGLLGMGCTKEGIGFAAGGTAGVVAGRSDKPIRDPNRKCMIFGTPDCKYEMEAQSNSAGSAFKWFKEQFCTEESLEASKTGKDVYDILTAKASESSPGSHGVFFMPYLAGANTPSYDVNARGTFIGMTVSHTKKDLIRAVMEGVVFEMKELFETLEKANVPEIKEIRATGGIARSDVWNQIQADIYNKTVVTTEYEEATALGSAIIATVGAGIYKDYEEACNNMIKIKKRYEPNPENVRIYEEAYSVWKSIFKSLSGSSYDDIAKFQDKYQ